jgi:hypothetical protein
MNAFISYSHQDAPMLDNFHKHLAQLQRDRLLKAWTDREVMAGGTLEQQIFQSLEDSQLFIALLSPDYIASRYCYEKEFERALKLLEQEQLIIIPIIVEPCDWLNTPFNQFKALPKDGKAVSLWGNQNTAFLDVIQNIRKLLTESSAGKPIMKKAAEHAPSFSRNYRIKKDFDSIEKLEFTEKTFHEIKDYTKRYIEEIIQLDNIKARPIIDTEKQFECWLVNRNKINAESQLKICIGQENNHTGFTRVAEHSITCAIESNSRPVSKSFSLMYDEFQMYWSESHYYSGSNAVKKIDAKGMADIIWGEWLESVGIL